MTAPASRPWLPGNAIAAAADALPMREVISDWSAKWFAGDGATLTGVETVGADGVVSASALVVDDGMTLALSDDAATRIGELMFGMPDSDVTAADLTAIAGAVEQAVTDLRQRLAELVGLPRNATWRLGDDGAWAGHRFRVGLGPDTHSLTILVADSLLVRSVKARLLPAPAVPLGKIAQGLAPLSVTLSALLGETRLSTGELTGLATGDVIVLDRRFDDVMPIAVDDVPQTVSCRVAAGAHHLDLTLA